MRTYEVMTIHRPELSEDEFAERVDGLVTFLTERGASVSNKDVWGKRRFAYEIRHLHEGYYSVVSFAAESLTVSELNRMLSLSDDVLRHKIARPAE